MKNYLNYTLWTGSVGVAFFIGTLSSDNKNSDEGSSKHRHEQAYSRSNSNKDLQHSKRLSTIRSKPSALDLEVLLEQDEPIDNLSFTTTFDSYRLVKGLNENELINALDELFQDENHTSGDLPVILLLTRLAEISPDTAIKYHDKYLDKNQQVEVINPIITSWAKIDPEAPFKWYQNTGSKLKGHYNSGTESLHPIFAHLASRSLDDAIEKMKSLKLDNHTHISVSNGIISSLTKKEDFIHFMNATNDYADKRRLHRSVIEKWSQVDPRSALEWAVSRQQKDERRGALSIVTQRWLSRAPDEAIEWMLTNKPEETPQGEYAVEIASKILHNSPKKASDWLETQNIEGDVKAILTFVDSSSWRDPELAARWLMKVPQSKRPEHVIMNLYHQWNSTDKERALEFLQESGIESQPINKS